MRLSICCFKRFKSLILLWASSKPSSIFSRPHFLIAMLLIDGFKSETLGAFGNIKLCVPFLKEFILARLSESFLWCSLSPKRLSGDFGYIGLPTKVFCAFRLAFRSVSIFSCMFCYTCFFINSSSLSSLNLSISTKKRA